MGWVRFFLVESQSGLYPHMRAKCGRDPTAVSKKVSFKFISRLFAMIFIQFCVDVNDYNGHWCGAMFERQMGVPRRYLRVKCDRFYRKRKLFKIP